MPNKAIMNYMINMNKYGAAPEEIENGLRMVNELTFQFAILIGAIALASFLFFKMRRNLTN